MLDPCRGRLRAGGGFVLLFDEMGLITGLGDSGLLLPASVGVFGYLVYQRAYSVALAWASALGLCLGLTVATKLGFNACGAEVPMLDISSPSGHTSFSATFFGCCALIAAAGRPLWQ